MFDILWEMVGFGIWAYTCILNRSIEDFSFWQIFLVLSFSLLVNSSLEYFFSFSTSLVQLNSDWNFFYEGFTSWASIWLILSVILLFVYWFVICELLCVVLFASSKYFQSICGSLPFFYCILLLTHTHAPVHMHTQ